MPRFSLVLPTLRRSDILGSCLATLIRQDFDDYEIVVQNNGRDPATEAVVRDLGGARVRHCYSDAVVTLTDNWEAGIANARGEFVTIVGDGDGLFPDCCRIAADVLDRTGLEVLSWPQCFFYWPRFIRPALRNRLFAPVDYDLCAQIIETEPLLRRVCRFEVGLWMPMIYHSFVRRSLLERAVAAGGRYLLSSFPDVSSGLVNVANVETFVRISRSLSITGLSHHSSAGNMFMSDTGHPSPETEKRDFGVSEVDDRLAPGDSTELRLANEMLLTPHEILLKRRGVSLDFHRLIEQMAATINYRPNFYEQTLTAIKTIAERHGINVADIEIPPPVAQGQQEIPSLAEPISANKVQFILDGEKLGLRNTADAIATLHQFVPRRASGTSIAIKAWEPDCGKLKRGQAITFQRLGDGVPGLAYGWADPEEWGAWSQSKRAGLRLMVDMEVEGDVHLALAYRAFVQHGMRPELQISCCALETEVAAWTCGPGNATGVQYITVPAQMISPKGSIDLEFYIANARSPAEAGFGSDTRLLGIGIETIELLGQPETTRSPSFLSWLGRPVERKVRASAHKASHPQ